MKKSIMRPLCILAVFTLMALLRLPMSPANELMPPIHPDEAEILLAIIGVEGHQVEAAEMPGWARGGIIKRLAEHGVATEGLQAWSVRGVEKPALFLSCVYNSDGRVLALSGNGPWLRDDSLRSLVGMPELRLISIDHNGFLRNHPQSPLYSGAGFDALVDSKLVEVKLTLGINDGGLKALANLHGLKTLKVVHSQVTDEGLKFLEGHPGLESFTVAEMGKVTQAALGSIAKMPNVTRVGFQEAFITYDDGFALLAPMQGRLQELDLSMSIVNDEDLHRVQADHPDAKITILPPAEIVKRHSGVAKSLARIATGDAAKKLADAIADDQAQNQKK